MSICSKFVGITRPLGPLLTSFASTTRSSFSRVRSFTGGSFNDRTSLLGNVTVPPVQPSAAGSSPAQAHEAPPLTMAALSIVSPATASDDTEEEEDAESRRVSKSVVPVSIFVASASVAMSLSYSNASGPGDDDGGVETAWHAALAASPDMAFISLSLFTSLALLTHSVVAARPWSPGVTRAQKAAMVMSLAFVLMSFMLRAAAMLPASSLVSAPTLAWVFLFLLAAAATSMFLYLLLTWKKDEAAGGARAAQGGADGATPDVQV